MLPPIPWSVPCPCMPFGPITLECTALTYLRNSIANSFEGPQAAPVGYVPCGSLRKLNGKRIHKNGCVHFITEVGITHYSINPITDSCQHFDVNFFIQTRRGHPAAQKDYTPKP